MKYLILLFLSFLFFDFSTSNAQLIRDYGIKVGLASTNQNWNWSSETGVIANAKSRQGFEGGLFIEWLNIPFLSFITEVNYIEKGSKVSTNIMVRTSQNPDGTGQYFGYSTRINYLSIPILAKLRINEGILTPYILLGPRFDFKLSSSSSYNNNPGPLYEYKNNDLGGTFGIGVELRQILLPLHLGLEFRYSPSFQYCYSVKYLSVKNSSLEFLLVLSY